MTIINSNQCHWSSSNYSLHPQHQMIQLIKSALDNVDTTNHQHSTPTNFKPTFLLYTLYQNWSRRPRYSEKKTILPDLLLDEPKRYWRPAYSLEPTRILTRMDTMPPPPACRLWTHYQMQPMSQTPGTNPTKNLHIPPRQISCPYHPGRGEQTPWCLRPKSDGWPKSPLSGYRSRRALSRGGLVI